MAGMTHASIEYNEKYVLMSVLAGSTSFREFLYAPTIWHMGQATLCGILGHTNADSKYCQIGTGYNLCWRVSSGCWEFTPLGISLISVICPYLMLKWRRRPGALKLILFTPACFISTCCSSVQSESPQSMQGCVWIMLHPSLMLPTNTRTKLRIFQTMDTHQHWQCLTYRLYTGQCHSSGTIPAGWFHWSYLTGEALEIFNTSHNRGQSVAGFSAALYVLFMAINFHTSEMMTTGKTSCMYCCLFWIYFWSKPFHQVLITIFLK